MFRIFTLNKVVENISTAVGIPKKMKLFYKLLIQFDLNEKLIEQKLQIYSENVDKIAIDVMLN